MTKVKKFISKHRIALAAFAVVLLVVLVAASFYFVKSSGSTMNKGGHSAHQTAVSSNAADNQPLLIVDIPLEKQQEIGVQFAAATLRALDYPIRSVARVSIDENTLSIISTRYAGFVEKLYTAETGQYVAAGQRVADIYSPDVYTAEREYLNLLKNPASGTDSGLLAVARERLSLLGVDETTIVALEKSGQVSRNVAVMAPSAGYIVQRQVLPGSQVQAGPPLLTIADLSHVWVIADIYEQDMALVHTGQRVTLAFDSMPNTAITTNIEYVYPMLDATTRTAKVRMTIDNVGGAFKPQLYGAVVINVGLRSTLTIPENAVINTGTRKLVYVDAGQGHLKQRVITTGYSAAGWVQVSSGLKVGERVVVAGNFLVDSEARLRGEVLE